MSILTGASAAALYGNRGSNGVIVITTRKGTDDKTRVRYSNNTTFMSPFVMQDFQNTYGRASESSYESWGHKAAVPYSYDPKDFFQTGVLENNSLSVSAGNQRSQTYISTAATNSKGIMPNNKYEKYNFTFRNSTTLVEDKLEADVSFNYTRQIDKNMYGQGQSYNPLVPLYLFPPSDDIGKYIVYERYNEERNMNTQYWPYGNLGMGLQNPYWIAYRNLFNTKRDKYTFTAVLNYNVTEWLSLKGRVRYDKLESMWTRRLYASTDEVFAVNENGNYIKMKSTGGSLYADFLIDIDKKINDDFRINGLLGASREDYSYNFLMNQGPLVYANFFHTSNLDRNRATYYESAGEKERTNSMFATAQLGFREYLFLDLTGRMDYFSTLHGTASTHKFYPSVGLSGVITDMFEIPKEVLSFWKLRTSYSQVGTPLRRYISQEYVTIDDQTQAVTAQGYPAGSNLVPERTKSFEAGTDFRLFSNKLDVSFTYYNANTYNQLFEYDKEPSSGYSKGWINAGKVNNWGSELSASGRVDLGPVRWTPSVAYSLNRNKIKSLLPETFIDESGEQITAPTEFVVANAGDSYLQILTVGGTMGDIYVNTFVKDHQGAIYVHPNTSTIQADPNARVYAGSALPLYNLGFRNSFTYKGITLDFLIDARVGGIVVSSTQALMDRFGTSKQSADARDAGGVPIYGKGLLDAKNFYTVAGSGDQGVLANYVYSATNVRLRELTIGYDIPSSLLWDKIDVRVAFVGRNLWMIHKKAPFDPEITGSTGTYYQGYDYFMPPSLRNLGFSISVSF